MFILGKFELLNPHLLGDLEPKMNWTPLQKNVLHHVVNLHRPKLLPYDIRGLHRIGDFDFVAAWDIRVSQTHLVEF